MKFLGEKQSGIAVLELNQPKNKNAFSINLVRLMRKYMDTLSQENNCRVLIIKSAVPGVFCAGADLKERAKLTPEQVTQFVNSLRRLLTDIEQLPMPVIAALDGAALGGGFEMALACDIRVASDDAKLGLVETKLAIIPGAGGTQRLPRIISPAIAKELIFTAKIFTGSEAKSMNIVNHSVPQNEKGEAAYAKALDVAMQILPNGPIGVKMAKCAIDRGIQCDLGTGYMIEEACYAKVIPTQDRLEGLKAFAEKRKPVYLGK